LWGGGGGGWGGGFWGGGGGGGGGGAGFEGEKGRASGRKERKLPSATPHVPSTAATPPPPPLSMPPSLGLFSRLAPVQSSHRVLLRVRRGHPGVAARQEGVAHLRLEDRVDAPLDEVMLGTRCAVALLAPGPSEADAGLPVLVLSESSVGHGGRGNRDKERRGERMGEAGERVEASKEKRSRSGSREVEKKTASKRKRKEKKVKLASVPSLPRARVSTPMSSAALILSL